MRWLQGVVPGLAGAAACTLAAVGCAAPAPLAPAAEIALPHVAGRIDHLALDAAHRRLFVAELAEGSLEAVDADTGRSFGRVAGLKEPQGLAIVPGRNELALATGGDGFLRFYRASDLRPLGALRLGDDADDVRFDGSSGRLLVGFGHALAVVDPVRRALIRRIALPAHPEGMQLRGGRIFVNLPAAGAVGVFDLQDGRELARWRNPGAGLNFPMAFDPKADLLAVVYRKPARLILFDAATGQVVGQSGTCGDADDAFFDLRRRRLYVVCGAGAVDVFEQRPGGYAHGGRIATRSGARTGLFAPELDRLFVAAPASGARPAAILVLQPPRPANEAGA